MSIQSEVFNTVLKKKQRRSTFDMSHDVKMSLDMGYLCPMYVQECVPGDNIRIQSHSMVRFAPLVSPVMHRMRVKMEYFFVPNRIIWSDWETWITGSRNGKQLPVEELPVFPTVPLFKQPLGDLFKSGSLADYLGLPTRDSFDDNSVFNNDLRVSMLPFAAYLRIYDEFYRDENLQDSVYDEFSIYFENYNSLKSQEYPAELPLGRMLELQKRAWQHDYFTSALPFAQKGESVEIPISTEDLRVSGKLLYDPDNHLQDYTRMWQGSQTVDVPPDSPIKNVDALTPTVHQSPVYANTADDDIGRRVNIDSSTVYSTENLRINNVDGSDTFLSTINDLRTAIRLQEWLENNARGGTRYIESIYAHFGVKSSDKRLNRPEYIGSNHSNVIVSEVLQTSSPQSETDTPQANMSGAAVNTNSSRSFKYYAEEHGYIIGLVTVIPDTAYFQGIPKHFMKVNDRLQYYFPEFAHLGEQEIKNYELYAEGQGTVINQTFGYIPRYSEYRYLTSRVCGDFRNSLKFWHLGRDFKNNPSLNSQFIKSDPSKRIFAVQDLPDDGSGSGGSVREFHSLYCHIFHEVKANRLMPKYGTPKL